jgi:hypothetical protein
MSRDFAEERRWQRIREESDKLYARVDPTGQLRAHYMKNPLLRFLWTASPKELAAHRKRFLAEQEAAGNILPPKDNAHC